jgi:hypothetical protein
MMDIYKYLPAILVLLSISTAFAQNISTYNVCSPDNSTLIHIRQVYINVPERNISRTIESQEVEICSSGCDPERNECNSPTWIYILIIMAIIILVYIGFKYVLIPMVGGRT